MEIFLNNSLFFSSQYFFDLEEIFSENFNISENNNIISVKLAKVLLGYYFQRVLCFEQLGANFEHFWPKLGLSPTLVLIGVSYPVLRPAFTL
jgi:hypothetical protein